MTQEAVGNRNYSLDLLKVLATVFIIFYHYQQIVGVRFPGPFNFCGGEFFWGYMVELFFVISGFLTAKYISRIAEGLRFPGFFLRKARRLLPIMAVAAVCFELVYFFYFRTYETQWFQAGFDLFGVLLDSLGLQVGWCFRNLDVNTPTWYCSVLLLCYAIFFFWTWLARRLRVSPAYFYILMVLLGCSLKEFWPSELPFIGVPAARGYYAFFFGVLLGMALDWFPLGKPLIGLSVFNAVAMICLIAWRPAFVRQGLGYMLSFILYPSLVILTQTKTAARLFRFRFLGELGKISYDAFVWHSPLLMGCYVLAAYFRVEPDISKPGLMYLFLLLAWAVGAVSHYLLEKPLDRLIGRLAAGVRAAVEEKHGPAAPEE